MKKVLLAIYTELQKIEGSKVVDTIKTIIANLTLILQYIEGKITTLPEMNITGNILIDEAISVVVQLAKWQLWPQLGQNIKAFIEDLTDYSSKVIPDYNAIVSGLNALVDSLLTIGTPVAKSAVISIGKGIEALKNNTVVEPAETVAPVAPAAPATTPTPVQAAGDNIVPTKKKI